MPREDVPVASVASVLARGAGHAVAVRLALLRWVEEGVAPQRIVATKCVGDAPAGGVASTRPLCPYPQVARHGGQDDPSSAASFRCVEDGGYENQMPAPEYLR